VLNLIGIEPFTYSLDAGIEQPEFINSSLPKLLTVVMLDTVKLQQLNWRLFKCCCRFRALAQCGVVAHCEDRDSHSVV
jgi:hypothetical protein